MKFFAQITGGLFNCFFSVMAIPAFAQYNPVETFKPIVYPPGKEYRKSAGTPGAKYWQNTAAYKIDVTLNALYNFPPGYGKKKTPGFFITPPQHRYCP